MAHPYFRISGGVLRWRVNDNSFQHLFFVFPQRAVCVERDDEYCYRLLKLELKQQQQQGLTLLVFLGCVPVVDNIVAEIIKQNLLRVRAKIQHT